MRRAQPTHPFEHFTATAEKLGISHADLAEKCGFSRHTWHSWQNGVPAPVANQCKMLLQLQATPAVNPVLVVVIAQNQEQANMISALCKGLNITTTQQML